MDALAIFPGNGYDKRRKRGERMDLRTLRYFVTVAEERNITRAAERLMISQPPLSSQMRALEEELGTQLFIRGKRHLKLTEAGVLLNRRARQILELTDKTKQEIASMDGLSGTINISLVEGRAPFLLSRWIAGFRSEFPTVKFRLWNGSGDDVVDRLYHGLADVGVVALPYNMEMLEGFPVGRESWVALISKKNPLAAEPGAFIKLERLAAQPLIVPSRRSRIEAIESWFKEIGAEPEIVCEMSSYIDAVALAEQDAGIGIFPYTTYTPNDLLAIKVITDSARQVAYALVWNKNQEAAEPVREFINFVRDSMEEEAYNAERYVMPENEYIPPEDTLFL